MIPQAFTTRDMSEAYRWLQTLPTSVREEMKSMEQVVSLYLRTKRLGGNTPSKEDIDNFKPVVPAPNPQDGKSQEFQKTLKSLRTELDSFDFTPEKAPQGPPPQVTFTPSSQPNPIENASLPLPRDPRSRQIINEIREALNLSSDGEVLRVSLVLAKKSLTNLL